MKLADRLTKSNNPMIKEEVLKGNITRDRQEVMTIQGGVNKSFVLFAVLLMAAFVGFSNPNNIFLYGGSIGGFIVSIIASRDLERSNIWAPLFAGLYGLAIGVITFAYGSMFEGIVFHAITITLAIFFTMLTLYKSGLIKVTEKFRSIIMTAMGAIMLLYIVSFILSLFSIDMPLLHDQSIYGVGISMGIVVIASLKLLVDFDNFDKGAQFGSPKYMEYYIAMGLLFTMIWLYTEILYILSYFMGSD
ncbi:MAG: Bax inhibitor-1/YccA family protein [Bacteroidota bacterium]